MLLTTRMLEKEGLENLSRNIPSIASACVTWQSFPNANPLNNSLRLFLRFGNCLCFPPFPEDQQHIQTGEAILVVLSHQNTRLSVLLVFQTTTFSKVGLYRQVWQCPTCLQTSSVLLACCTPMPSSRTL